MLSYVGQAAIAHVGAACTVCRFVGGKKHGDPLHILGPSQAANGHSLRRGLVGFLPVYKVAGAAAEQGASLDKCLEIAERMQGNMRTLAVAVRTATHPSTGQAIFDLGDDEMEIGMGQHGEAGTGQMKLKSADETAAIMLEMLLNDLKVSAGEQLLVIMNGAGATTLMELLIVFRRVAQMLQEKGIRLARTAIGEFITTQEQAGFQMMIARMDEELIELWDAPADTPFFTRI